MAVVVNKKRKEKRERRKKSLPLAAGFRNMAERPIGRTFGGRL